MKGLAKFVVGLGWHFLTLVWLMRKQKTKKKKRRKKKTKKKKEKVSFFDVGVLNYQFISFVVGFS